MQRNISVVGRQAIEWEEVEMYLKQYVGEARIIKSTEEGEIKYYKVFKVIMVVRHAEDGRMYLYDIMNIKKETGTHFQS